MITDTLQIVDTVFELCPQNPSMMTFAEYYAMDEEQYRTDQEDGTLLINMEQATMTELTIDTYKENLSFIDICLAGESNIDFRLFNKLMDDEAPKPMAMYPEFDLDDSFNGFTLEHFVFHCFCLKSSWPEEHKGTLLSSVVLMSVIKATLVEAVDKHRDGKFKDVGPWLLVNMEESLERVRTQYNSLISGMENKIELDTNAVWVLFMAWILAKAEFCRRIEEEENL